MEWESALTYLPPSLRSLMVKPLFSLSDMRRRWGYWSSAKNEICLSRRLALHHPWDAVREVFLHETAHQVAGQALGFDHSPPHGAPFLEACRLLRANPKASGNYPLLDARLAAASPHGQDRILLRIHKLLSLATSRNRHEAEAAMAKAHELIAKYNIDLAAQRENRSFISSFLGKPALRHTRDQYHLASLLLNYYAVAGIWINSYVVERGKMGRVLEISGTLENVQIAAYVHDFIQRFIQKEWQAYNRDKRLGCHRRTDFAVGIIEGFATKLDKQGGKAPSAGRPGNCASRTLIRMEDPQLKRFMRERYPRTRTFRRQGGRQDAGVVRDGVKRGKTLVISKGITQAEPDRRSAPELLKG